MLITEKRYHFETSEGKKLHPYIREFFTSESQTLFTWPCAILLASYIAATNATKRCRTIELGAGCGLPSIVAGLCGAISCVLTERADEPLVLQNLELNVAKNDLCRTCSVLPLDWNAVQGPSLPEVDVVLGADIFYSSEDFEFIFALVDKLTKKNGKVVFFTTYQERSTRRSIAPYLEKYSMTAEVIPLESFLHTSHLTDGMCNILGTTISHENTKSDLDVSMKNRAEKEIGDQVDITKTVRHAILQTFDSMLLLKITKKMQ